LKRKNRLWDKIRKQKQIDEKLLNKYKIERKEIGKKIKECKKQFLIGKLNNLQKNKKNSIWTVVNEIVNKSKTKNIDREIEQNFEGEQITEIANNFNENFSKIIPELKNKNKKEYEDYKRGEFYGKLVEKDKKNVNRTKVKKSMYIEKANQIEIENMIMELNNTKATGYDGILTEHIKHTKENTSKAVCTLINAMIEKETWPEMLKMQIIRPIYKKGDKKNLNNYRPIVLLSVIDKILENFFANRIRRFMEINKVLNTKQYGYTKNKSTTELLIDVNELITKGLNEGKYIGIILIDLQKAFDSFDQKILLRKCYNFGLRGKIYNILKTYLKDRKTVVKIKDELSKTININTGVPQGSVLGPLLYLIYTNDIHENLEKTNIFLFADDTLLISIHNKYEEMMNNLQHDFNILNDYFIKNELYLSGEKTFQMDVTVPKMKPKKEIWIIKHHGNCEGLIKNDDKKLCNKLCTKLEKKNSTNYLGLCIDNNWNFKEHIIELIKKLRQLIPRMYHLKQILNNKQKKIVYDAWIGSIIRYGIEIYGQTSEYLIERLQKIHNKLIKVMFGNNKSKKTTTLYKENEILKIKELMEFIMVTKNYYCNTYKTISKSIGKFRGNKRRYDMPSWNNIYGKRRKIWKIPELFNKIPKEMLEYVTLNEFKKKYKDWLIKHQK